MTSTPNRRPIPPTIRTSFGFTTNTAANLLVTRQAWRTDVLPGTIRSNWDNTGQLYNVIIAALNDGFRADIVEAAAHLYQTDPERMRATNLWGIVLTEEARLDEADTLFSTYTRQHGESAFILTNLAKVFAKRGNAAKAGSILGRALELDPNQSNGLA